MHIINAMFAKNLGGIEQCAVDYAQGLASKGHKITCLVQPDAAVIPALQSISGVETIEISNRGQWDFVAKLRLRKILKKLSPDVMIAHGNRALKLLARMDYPLVGVTHNYSLAHMKKADAVIALTNDLARHAISQGVAEQAIIRLPNMIQLEKKTVMPKRMQQPPVIGAMGRLVKKKGFDIFFQALAVLKEQKVLFQAILAGDGEEAESLKHLASELKLTSEDIHFTGWINNKNELFDKVDIFCVPSHHEPFGIIVLEALTRALPVVSTASEGPSEILTHEKDALLTPVGDAKALAEALKKLIQTPKLCADLAKNGQRLVNEKYSMNVVADALSTALEAMLAKHMRGTK